MGSAKPGDTVKVHYTGKLRDGTVFDTSTKREPLEFTIGQRQVIPGFEEAVVGMDSGDSKNVEIAADQAYGPHRDEMVVAVGREKLPEEVEPEVGQQLNMQQPDGQAIPVRITEVLDQAGVNFQVNAMSTTVEGEWQDVMNAIHACHQAVRAAHTRVLTSINIDDFRGEGLREETV